MANQIWNYQSDFINRVLYKGESFYTLSESSTQKWSFSDTKNKSGSIEFSVDGKPLYTLPTPRIMR